MNIISQQVANGNLTGNEPIASLGQRFKDWLLYVGLPAGITVALLGKLLKEHFDKNKSSIMFA